MKSEISKMLLSNKISKKEFTKGICKWFINKINDDFGISYQREKNVTRWWTIALYCTFCLNNTKSKEILKCY